MKLRAPRCRDSVLLISVPDLRSAMPPSSSATAARPKRSAAVTIVINTELLSMSCDPFRHRLHAIEFRVPGHQQKERKIQNRAYLGQRRVDARRRFQAADCQGDERHNEDGQHNLVYGAAVADRTHRRAIQPWYEEQHHDGG